MKKQPIDNLQAGFTLLEILLVIVMIAVTSAMVVPSISNVSSGSVEDESDRLRVTMRLAMEESQLSGVPLRWLATKGGWYFESLTHSEEGNEWLAYEESPLTTYVLPGGVSIETVEQAGDFSLSMEPSEAEAGQEKEPVIGMVLLLPDGTTSQSNISLVGEGVDLTRVLQIRPGPSGIRLQKVEE